LARSRNASRENATANTAKRAVATAYDADGDQLPSTGTNSGKYSIEATNAAISAMRKRARTPSAANALPRISR
jgi:hypothetical protein